jgi:C4-dicarboxylate-specific signal transduction histidine kinase
MNRRLIVLDDENAVLDSYRVILTPRPVINAVLSSRKPLTTATAPAPNDGFDVEYVSTGAQALFLIESGIREGRPFVGGFFDVKLGPGIDGIETIRLARAMDPNMFCVVVTAYQDRSLDQLTKILGVDSLDQWDYVAKPFTETEILQKARNVVAAWNKRERQREFVEQLKEQMDQLVKADRISSVGMVAKGVSHEVGNLLLKARWKLEGLLDGKGKTVSIGELNSVLKLVTQAAGTLGNLQYFVQEDNQPEKFTITEALSEAVSLTDGSRDQMGARIELTTDKDLPAVEFSRSRVSHVFVNLVLNALQATRPGEGQIKIHAFQEDGGVAVEFTDNGHGISPEVRARVFDPLFTTKDGHLGIGLTVAKRIVEQVGGRLTVTSQVGKGSSFTVHLPHAGQPVYQSTESPVI